ncbi:TerD family protein [Nocardia asteroides]|uniref:TerD family protein n=1 Tax=Nocardia asteroides TaxID=1824 RepID=UPI001E37469C|nr:TerD family protein [Nocardia asteroides]UGT61580.1 TerD family protein [Nocardia asteroides]
MTVGHAGGPGAVDVAAVLLGGDGKVRGDEDLVFYNNPKQPGVVLLSEASVGIDLAAVPPGIHRIVVTGSTEAQGRDFGSLGSLTVTVQGHSEGFRFVPDRLSTETVLQVVALYRRNGRGRTGCPARTPTRSRCSSGTA